MAKSPEFFERGYLLAEQCYMVFADEQDFSDDQKVLPPFKDLPDHIQRAWRLACLSAYKMGQVGEII